MSNSSIWPIDRILQDATTPELKGPGRDANEGILHIPESFRVKASPSDGLMSYQKHTQKHFSAEMPPVYSTAPADRAIWKLFILDRNTWKIELLISNSNARKHLTMCKQIIDIK